MFGSSILSQPTPRTSHKLYFLVWGIFSLMIPLNAISASEIMENPLKFLNDHPSELLNIQSKEDALQLYLQSNPSFIEKLPNQPTGNKSVKKIQIPAFIQDAITQIMAGFVALQTISDISKPDMTTEPSQQSASSSPWDASNFQWLRDTPIFQPFARSARLQQTLSALQSIPDSPIEDTDMAYLQFETYFNNNYTMADKDSMSWIMLWEGQGLEGIQDRLNEYPNTPSAFADSPQSTNSTMAQYARHYLRTRLLPFFQTHSQAEFQALQRQAYKILLAQIPVITQWQQEEQQRTMLARLCGSWLWTLHNHQNHQDHKMTVNFYPPGEPIPPNQPAPTTIAVHGDTVYIEWIFPQGKQADSLLLSNRDTIMEGTFKNTLGPYGSISGKRLTACKP